MAEFYMTHNHPQKDKYRRQFISLVREHWKIGNDSYYLVPYEDGFLPTYRFTPENPKETLVMFGGFDGYAEEALGVCVALSEAGFDIVYFDGPGQGAALEDYHIPMTHEWEKPVGAILDYFKLDDVTLAGMSLGGCLVIRAAAHEKRVKRVIADDICTDFFETILRQFPEKRRKLVRFLVEHENKIHSSIINGIVRKLMKKRLMIEWGIAQGMRIMGVQTPYEFLRKCTLLNTYDVSSLLTQDVLIMGGQQDHYIPLHQFFDQAKMLTNVRSLTSRLFTTAETAQNHCQLGNIGLSAEVIVNWVEQTILKLPEQKPRTSPRASGLP
jgi:pimeloyl-ACP methyl ester carboxylesterase